MTKKSAAVISHVEIIARAIHSIDCDIKDWRDQIEKLTDVDHDKLLAQATRDLVEKREALKIMYRIETGCEIDG